MSSVVWELSSKRCIKHAFVYLNGWQNRVASVSWFYLIDTPIQTISVIYCLFQLRLGMIDYVLSIERNVRLVASRKRILHLKLCESQTNTSSGSLSSLTGLTSSSYLSLDSQ